MGLLFFQRELNPEAFIYTYFKTTVQYVVVPIRLFTVLRNNNFEKGVIGICGSIVGICIWN